MTPAAKLQLLAATPLLLTKVLLQARVVLPAVKAALPAAKAALADRWDPLARDKRWVEVMTMMIT